MEPPQDPYPQKTLYSFLREKHRTEIRKAQTANIFKTKRMSFHPPLDPSPTQSFDIAPITKSLDSPFEALRNPKDENEFLDALKLLREHSSDVNLNRISMNYLIRKGLFDILGSALNEIHKYSFPVQEEVIWLLCNATFFDAKDTSDIKRDHLVEPLSNLLFRRSHGINEKVIWTIGNLADDDAKCRETLLRVGVIDRFREELLNGKMVSISVLTSFLTLLFSLCQDNNKETHREVARNLDLILIGIECMEEDAFGFAVLVISRLRDGPLEGFLVKVLNELSEEKIKNMMLICVKTEDNEARNNCLSLICEFLAVDDKWTEVNILLVGSQIKRKHFDRRL